MYRLVDVAKQAFAKEESGLPKKCVSHRTWQLVKLRRWMPRVIKKLGDSDTTLLAEWERGGDT